MDTNESTRVAEPVTPRHTFYVFIWGGSIWGMGDTAEEAIQAAHAESQRTRDATDDGPPETPEEDYVVQGGTLVTMTCNLDQRDTLAAFIRGMA